MYNNIYIIYKYKYNQVRFLGRIPEIGSAQIGTCKKLSKLRNNSQRINYVQSN